MNQPALDRAVLRILSYHIGRSRAISRTSLQASLQGFPINERQLRELIKQLRRQGHLIGSAPGETGGYYLISDANEFQEFMRTEFMAMIADMSETAAAMRLAAEKQFGPSAYLQPSLFKLE